MARFRFVLVSALTGFLPALPAHATDLALKRVMLSTGGVGYFEYEARVAGDAILPLDVRRDQVDDVMKSIVVYDDKGGVGQISLPGEEPLREVFRELPFGQEAFASPVALLNALRGAEVTVIGNKELTGRVIAVTDEIKQLPDDRGTIVQHRITLLTPDGMRQGLLEEIDSLRFTDPQLQAQVAGALAALARHGERDRRTLSVRTTGPAEAERTVRVAYVVEAPLWKASYRLTLGNGTAPPSSLDQSQLQGWAVLENVSGKDWHEVDLTVISGHPVTFRQALYASYYVPRPEVPVEVLGRVLPRIDEGAVAAPTAGARLRESPEQGGSPPPGARAPMMMKSMPAPSPQAMPPEDMTQEAMPADEANRVPAESTEATTQVTFHFPIPVSVANGNSVLLPIVAKPVPAARIALYQPATHPRHPLAAVRLSNDGSTGLPPGILTLYEHIPGTHDVTYIGDARLGALPPGDERLLSFALDQKVIVDRSDTTTQTTARAKIADGLLRLTMTERAATTYNIAGARQERRTVIVEHPRRDGWDLVEPKDVKAGQTADALRLPVEVPAGQTVTLTVVQERPRQQAVELLTLPVERITAFANNGELPDTVRQAMTRLATLRAGVTDRQRAAEQARKERDGLAADQQRLRDNLAAVPEGSDLQRRYLAKLGEQENRLDGLDDTIAKAQQDVEAARKALTDYVRGLNL